MNFYISDTHFGHKNIIKHANRPFDTVEDMDEAMMTAWNDTIRPNDTIYFLGDFSFSKPKLAIELLKSLRGNKVFVSGNHDTKDFRKLIAASGIPTYNYLEVNDPFLKNKLILSHYPIYSWRNKEHGSLHLFGHCHGGINDHEFVKRSACLDVGVDSVGFKPIDSFKVEELIKDKLKSYEQSGV